MSLRKLPEIQAVRLPSVCAFEPDPDALERWNAAIVAQDSGAATISILDMIGEDDWIGGGVTAKRVSAALRSIGARDVRVDINSPGGDFFEGVAIYNALRAHPHKVSVRILGVAASAASVIAMAGDDVQIGKAGFLMLHNAWAMTIGNRHDMAEAARILEPFDAAMAAVYAERSGQDVAKAAEWMDAETWFGGDAAVEAGLADSLLPADAVTEDKTKAEALLGVNATRRIDARLAKTGMPRSERRALLADAKRGMSGAALTATQDAGDIAALIQGLRKTIST
ncbi:Clp protease ClpP [Roseovarius sp. SCSIO 43702]|uniref:head maturation protease, ClpP-related n=1 Tax=Roseovarius sp. SCSIO 43702 TaxID=2823043 RepID=UPI001C7336D2|nr:head maturation protease, ClpP-related [Roseovarius sp. SCSIO 43702]QYX58077.1 Clp protease ClpP [Roseovarius sp. SCSIO 43702]